MWTRTTTPPPLHSLCGERRGHPCWVLSLHTYIHINIHTQCLMLNSSKDVCVFVWFVMQGAHGNPWLQQQTQQCPPSLTHSHTQHNTTQQHIHTNPACLVLIIKTCLTLIPHGNTHTHTHTHTGSHALLHGIAKDGSTAASSR